MKNYKPSLPFTTPVHLLIPVYEEIKGTLVAKYPEAQDGDIIFVSFKTYGGTDVIKNNVYAVEDTASIETWYQPAVKSDCIIELESGAKYEILGAPENIEMRNQFLKFKVRRLTGGA